MLAIGFGIKWGDPDFQQLLFLVREGSGSMNPCHGLLSCIPISGALGRGLEWGCGGKKKSQHVQIHVVLKPSVCTCSKLKAVFKRSFVNFALDTDGR